MRECARRWYDDVVFLPTGRRLTSKCRRQSTGRLVAVKNEKKSTTRHSFVVGLFLFPKGLTDRKARRRRSVREFHVTNAIVP